MRGVSSLSAFQQGAVAVLLPFVAFVVAFFLPSRTPVTSSQVAVVSIVSFGFLIPCAILHILNVRMSEGDAERGHRDA